MISSLPATLRRFLLSNPWRLLALLFALLNLKSLPFAWHLRLLHGLLLHIRSSRLRLRSFPGPVTLFKPLITSSRSGPLECDYNLHKSNSTYFSDFDIGRLQLLVSLIGNGMNTTAGELRTSSPLAEELRLPASEKGKRFIIALGAVSCHFKREIKPFESFEVWTRILTWDRKWLYVIGHFVKKGTVKPRGGYLYQPWKNSKSGNQIDDHENNSGSNKSKPVIFASAIAKYCFKKGRLTVPPEAVLHASQLLPAGRLDGQTHGADLNRNTEKSMAVEQAVRNEEQDVNVGGNDAGAIGLSPVANAAAQKLVSESAADTLTTSLNDVDSISKEEWTWERVEQERLEGMKLAELFTGLDTLSEKFAEEGCTVLGEY